MSADLNFLGCRCRISYLLGSEGPSDLVFFARSDLLACIQLLKQDLSVLQGSSPDLVFRSHVVADESAQPAPILLSSGAGLLNLHCLGHT